MYYAIEDATVAYGFTRPAEPILSALIPSAFAFLQAHLPAFLAPLLPPFLEDVLEGAGVAPESFGDAKAGHDLGG